MCSCSEGFSSGGRVEKYYVSLPDELPPGYNAEMLARSFMKYLREMLRYAKLALQ
jgi:hypothetical protein